MKRLLALVLIVQGISLYGMDDASIGSMFTNLQSAFDAKKKETQERLFSRSLEDVPLYCIQGISLVHKDFVQWVDEGGNTFMHRLAGASHDEELIRFVLGSGVNLARENMVDQTPAAVAQEVGNTTVLDLIAQFEDQSWQSTVDNPSEVLNQCRALAKREGRIKETPEEEVLMDAFLSSGINPAGFVAEIPKLAEIAQQLMSDIPEDIHEFYIELQTDPEGAKQKAKDALFAIPFTVDLDKIWFYKTNFEDFMTWTSILGDTVLHHLAHYCEDADIIQFVLGQEPDLRATNSFGQTVRVCAEESDNQVMLELLQRYEDNPWKIDPLSATITYARNPHVDGSQDDSKKSSWFGTLYDCATVRNAFITGVGIYFARLAWKRYMSPAKEEVQ